MRLTFDVTQPCAGMQCCTSIFPPLSISPNALSFQALLLVVICDMSENRWRRVGMQQIVCFRLPLRPRCKCLQVLDLEVQVPNLQGQQFRKFYKKPTLQILSPELCTPNPKPRSILQKSCRWPKPNDQQPDCCCLD